MENSKLVPNENWQTPQRGTHRDEYEIYVSCARAQGWKIKTYEEWLAS